MKKKSDVKSCASSNNINRINKIISAFICGVTLLSAMTGCEKASERTIYITPIDSGTSSGSDSSNFSDKVENIGSAELLKKMTFKFEGIEMCLDKKPYSDFKEKGWTFDPATYGIENTDVELGCIFQRSIFLKKEGYDQDVFCIGITNFEAAPCKAEDAQLWSVEFTAHEKTKYPEIIVDGGITWGSKKEDIIKAYGEPDSADKKDGEECTVMHYTDNSGSDVYFDVYDNEGVGKITLEMYKP